MASTNNRTSAKFCPRCGAFYNDLKSKTCPQCFALLEVLNEDAAEFLTAEQAARRSDPALRAAIEAEDEKFKEQAFGGCLGVATIAILTVILAAVIVGVGMHRLNMRAAAIKREIAAADHKRIDTDSFHLPTTLLGSKSQSQSYANVQFASVDYGGGLELFADPSAAMTVADLQNFREQAAISAARIGATHSSVEIAAHGVDYIVYAPTEAQARSAATDLSK